MVKLFSGNRHNVIKKVVRMRTKSLMSWAAIAAELDIAPRTARKLFQEGRGVHQHHDHLPNKGGRFPAGQFTEEAVIVWSPEEGAYLAGDGSNNVWFKTELPV